MKELPQKEEASSARERLGETLWQFDLWPTYRVIALPIVEIEEKERVARSRGRKKKGVVRDESMNAQAFFFLPASFAIGVRSLSFQPYPSTLYTLHEYRIKKK